MFPNFMPFKRDGCKSIDGRLSVMRSLLVLEILRLIFFLLFGICVGPLLEKSNPKFFEFSFSLIFMPNERGSCSSINGPTHMTTPSIFLDGWSFKFDLKFSFPREILQQSPKILYLLIFSNSMSSDRDECELSDGQLHPVQFLLVLEKSKMKSFFQLDEILLKSGNGRVFDHAPEFQKSLLSNNF